MLTFIHIHWIVGIILLLYSITIVGLILVIITENRNPLKTIPWVVVLLFTPGIGLVFYFFFGQDNRKQRIISRHTYKRITKRAKESELPQDICTVPASYQPLATLLTNRRCRAASTCKSQRASRGFSSSSLSMVARSSQSRRPGPKATAVAGRGAS